jgi:energy-coupling factor transporter ATP-binding protein EcfA2
MDTEMLAAMEDMLDSWAGTLLLVSHDRYLMERVTDSQYALIDGQIRHLPAGVDEFVDLLKNRETKPEVPAKISSEILVEQSIGAWLRQQRKLLATTERKIVTLEKKRAEITAEMLAADPADYLTLAGLEQELRSVGVQISQMEDTRMELSELLENRA